MEILDRRQKFEVSIKKTDIPELLELTFSYRYDPERVFLVSRNCCEVRGELSEGKELTARLLLCIRGFRREGDILHYEETIMAFPDEDYYFPEMVELAIKLQLKTIR